MGISKGYGVLGGMSGTCQGGYVSVAATGQAGGWQLGFAFAGRRRSALDSVPQGVWFLSAESCGIFILFLVGNLTLHHRGRCAGLCGSAVSNESDIHVGRVLHSGRKGGETRIEESSAMAPVAAISFSSEVVVEVLREQSKREFGSAGRCEGASSDMVDGLLRCRRQLHSWFRQQGLSEGSATRAIRLCEEQYLEDQPRPGAWNRCGKFGVSEHRRYLWYRHAARLLGWCERKPFPAFVTDIIRTHIYRTVGQDDEEACSCPREVIGCDGPNNSEHAGEPESGGDTVADSGNSIPPAFGKFQSLCSLLTQLQK